MQCYVKSSENLIQEFCLPYGQLVPLEVCRNYLGRIRPNGPFRAESKYCIECKHFKCQKFPVKLHIETSCERPQLALAKFNTTATSQVGATLKARKAQSLKKYGVFLIKNSPKSVPFVHGKRSKSLDIACY